MQAMPLAAHWARASGSPATESWSVSARILTWAAAARTTTSAGARSPSEWCECRCRSTPSVRAGSVDIACLRREADRFHDVAQEHDEALAARDSVLGVVEHVTAAPVEVSLGV